MPSPIAFDLNVALPAPFVSESAAGYRVSKTKKGVLIVTAPGAKQAMARYVTVARKLKALTKANNTKSVIKQRAAIKRELRALLNKAGLSGFAVISATKVRRKIATKTILAGTYALQFEESVNAKKARAEEASKARALSNKEISALSSILGKYALSLPRSKNAKNSRRFFVDKNKEKVGYLRKSANGAYVISVTGSGSAKSKELDKVLNALDKKLHTKYAGKMKKQGKSSGDYVVSNVYFYDDTEQEVEKYVKKEGPGVTVSKVEQSPTGSASATLVGSKSALTAFLAKYAGLKPSEVSSEFFLKPKDTAKKASSGKKSSSPAKTTLKRTGGIERKLGPAK